MAFDRLILLHKSGKMISEFIALGILAISRQNNAD